MVLWGYISCEHLSEGKKSIEVVFSSNCCFFFCIALNVKQCILKVKSCAEQHLFLAGTSSLRQLSVKAVLLNCRANTQHA